MVQIQTVKLFNEYAMGKQLPNLCNCRLSLYFSNIVLLLEKSRTPFYTYIILQLINYKSYDALVFFQVLLVVVALNQTWIALLTALICAAPGIAFRLSPVIAAVAGFSSGFFIPIDVMHWG